MEAALSADNDSQGGDAQETDDLFDGIDGENTDAAGSASGSDDAPQDEGTPDPKDSKRIDDLMSKWQKAEAENAKLKAQLAAGTAQADGANGGEGSAEPSNEFIEFQRELVRKGIFESDPRLATYGLDATAIAGTTVAEMQASLDRQRKLIDSVETKARQKALREHGIAPDAGSGSGGAAKPVDYASMSAEDFEKAVAKAAR